MKTRTLVSFDWAIKRLLRNKANFEVLEGFLSELLRRKIVIKSIGESEANKEEDDGEKGNIVDLLVEADDKELVIIELQDKSEAAFFFFFLYTVSKTITNHIERGMPYDRVRKIYSINIAYFELGTGDDYIYHGTFSFKGLHTGNHLNLTATQQLLYNKMFVGEIHPEYYIIKVKQFNDVAKNTLDEWVYYLKNNKIEDHFTAQGLNKVKEILLYDNLTPEEKRDYDKALDEKLRTDDAFRTSRLEGKIEGEENTNKKVIANALKAGYSIDVMTTITGLTQDEVTEIINSIQTDNTP
jgi:predicted transposase/invertase (TIGR01784 family)